MGEMADYYLDLLLYPFDFDDDDDFYQTRSVQCNRCGSKKVHWANKGTESKPLWLLHNDGVLNDVHACNPVDDNEFEDLTEEK
jgi:hypothetical protein